MGLLLSVLVVCVGVLEVLACVRHFRDGYLPVWTPHRTITAGGLTTLHEHWRKKPNDNSNIGASGGINNTENLPSLGAISLGSCVDKSHSEYVFEREPTEEKAYYPADAAEDNAWSTPEDRATSLPEVAAADEENAEPACDWLRHDGGALSGAQPTDVSCVEDSGWPTREVTGDVVVVITGDDGVDLVSRTKDDVLQTAHDLVDDVLEEALVESGLVRRPEHNDIQIAAACESEDVEEEAFSLHVSNSGVTPAAEDVFCVEVTQKPIETIVQEQTAATLLEKPKFLQEPESSDTDIDAVGDEQEEDVLLLQEAERAQESVGTTTIVKAHPLPEDEVGEEMPELILGDEDDVQLVVRKEETGQVQPEQAKDRGDGAPMPQNPTLKEQAAIGSQKDDTLQQETKKDEPTSESVGDMVCTGTSNVTLKHAMGTATEIRKIDVKDDIVSVEALPEERTLQDLELLEETHSQQLIISAADESEVVASEQVESDNTSHVASPAFDIELKNAASLQREVADVLSALPEESSPVPTSEEPVTRVGEDIKRHEEIEKEPKAIHSPTICMSPMSPRKSKADISWPIFSPPTPVIKRPSIPLITSESAVIDTFQSTHRPSEVDIAALQQQLNERFSEIEQDDAVSTSEDVEDKRVSHAHVYSPEAKLPEAEIPVAAATDHSMALKDVLSSASASLGDGNVAEDSGTSSDKLSADSTVESSERDDEPSDIFVTKDLSKKEMGLKRRRSYRKKRHSSASDLGSAQSAEQKGGRPKSVSLDETGRLAGKKTLRVAQGSSEEVVEEEPAPSPRPSYSDIASRRLGSAAGKDEKQQAPAEQAEEAPKQEDSKVSAGTSVSQPKSGQAREAFWVRSSSDDTQ